MRIAQTQDGWKDSNVVMTAPGRAPKRPTTLQKWRELLKRNRKRLAKMRKRLKKRSAIHPGWGDESMISYAKLIKFCLDPMQDKHLIPGVWLDKPEA